MAAPPDGDTAAELDYRLQIGVPPNWIPYLPQSSGYGAIKLGQGRMTRDDGSLADPVGVLLNDPGVQVVADEDVPREGAEVRRVPMLARRVDGSYVRWTARRVTLGRGEGSSGLAFRRRPPTLSLTGDVDVRGSGQIPEAARRARRRRPMYQRVGLALCRGKRRLAAEGAQR